MDDNSRREHLKMLLGMAALGGTPLAALAASAKSQEVVPPQGIGYRIAHISYSDQGAGLTACRSTIAARYVATCSATA